MNRRLFLSLISTLLFSSSKVSIAHDNGLNFGHPIPFDFDILMQLAKSSSLSEFNDDTPKELEIIKKINYDFHNQIFLPPENNLYAKNKPDDTVSFFHVGEYFPYPVKMYSLENGQSREILYTNRYFDIPPTNPASEITGEYGFAGFRIHDGQSSKYPYDDWASFLGASYFRSCGDLRQYGASARGIAINTANPSPPYTEEFPRFTKFWIAPILNGSTTVLALLEGPSITGAYKFTISKNPKIIFDVTCKLFIRKHIERLGIAPITSMYWYSDTMRWMGTSWRPEIHDSDGVYMISGRGEQIWRPLNNPPHVMVSAFSDENPKGFGLLQRDRNFNNYLDDIGFFKRPNVWIEPLGKWGKGSIQLLEMPTSQEIEDNIGLFWVPEKTPEPGDEYEFSYKIHWNTTEPLTNHLAKFTSTKLTPGFIQNFDGVAHYVRDFVLDFKGDILFESEALKSEPSIDGVNGKIIDVSIDAFPSPGQWRLCFRVAVPDENIRELRVFVKNKDNGLPLTETWMYQYFPSYQMVEKTKF